MNSSKHFEAMKFSVKTLCYSFLAVLFTLSVTLWAHENHKAPDVSKSEMDRFLHRTGTAELKGRIDKLMRRIEQLEDKKRFLEERIQNLERRVDDSKRQHDRRSSS